MVRLCVAALHSSHHFSTLHIITDFFFPSMFITFEGLDYCGKSTQAQLLGVHLSREGFKVLMVREPGGTEIGERIRSILLDQQAAGMSDITEVFLFSASRAQIVRDVIRPALEAGTIVVCDRFYDSTTAYQGWGRKIPLDGIEAINRTATGGLRPALTVFLDVPLDELERRMRARPGGKDRIELNGRPFYRRVRKGYLEIAAKEKRVLVLDGTVAIDQLENQIWKHVAARMKRRKKT
jgi:dTMP kinase